ncbi:MAG: DinB family protein [Tepidisphaeraceae bacterium]
MTPLERTADVLNRNLEMVKATLSDFSDADFYTRPCPGANHPAWQIGHLISSETGMVSAMDPKAAAKLPEGFDKKFTKETAKKDDPAFFGSKAQLMDQFAKTRAATIAWVKTLKPADLDKPAPEPLRSFAPTLGHVLEMLPMHVAMHMGQFQVTRRRLGKPILH